MHLYPLKFEPIYKEKIWGGNRIQQLFGRELPSDRIGESWEVAAHPNGTSRIINGIYKGDSLVSLISRSPADVLGNHTSIKDEKKFPLLLKILDANDKLSVQVHPDDCYAQRVEGEKGKTEMWYIIKAEPGAKLVYGLKPGTTRDDFSRAIENGKLTDYLNEIEVKEGDIIFIPSGTIHAIKKGILLAEIQQNSDTTYRVYDWGRPGQDGKPRELHIKQALDVINFNDNKTEAKNTALTIRKKEYCRHFLAACPFFAAEKIKLIKHFEIIPAGRKFYILMNLSGQGCLEYHNRKYNITPGDTFFLPAALEKVLVRGQLQFLLAYLPENREKIINKLKRSGFNDSEINKLAGLSDWN